MTRLSPFMAVMAAGFVSLLPAQESPARFAELAAERILEQPSVRGDDQDWFFLVRELKHLATGEFWEQPWEEVAVNQSDPLPSLIEFHNLLAERGIHLVIAPVPAKAATYPERLIKDYAHGKGPSHGAFLKQLEEAGLLVVDVEPDLRKYAAMDSESPVYCRQDAHLSPLGIEILANAVVKACDGLVGKGAGEFEISQPEDLSITGDQVAGSEWEGKVANEILSTRYVTHEGARGVEPVADSPILLLGDSHTLVFHTGASTGMHCKGAGLADHLSFQFQQPVDLVGVRGSGMVQARKQLFYHATGHQNYWSGKRVVIWVFSIREFTQSRDRYISVPLDR